MHKDTIERAYKLVRSDNIELFDDSTWDNMHFEVLGFDGQVFDVWRKTKGNEIIWECNNQGGEFGCVMINPFQSYPQCSHTLACEIFVRKKKIIKVKQNGRN